MDYVVIEGMVGRRVASVTGREGDNEVVFTFEDGGTARFFHEQDCCESVRVEDVVGDLQDLVGGTITVAEEWCSVDWGAPSEYSESYTWTFYEFATELGSVTVRWLGESNGYYSESVSYEVSPRPEASEWLEAALCPPNTRVLVSWVDDGQVDVDSCFPWPGEGRRWTKFGRNPPTHFRYLPKPPKSEEE